MSRSLSELNPRAYEPIITGMFHATAGAYLLWYGPISPGKGQIRLRRTGSNDEILRGTNKEGRYQFTEATTVVIYEMYVSWAPGTEA